MCPPWHSLVLICVSINGRVYCWLCLYCLITNRKPFADVPIVSEYIYYLCFSGMFEYDLLFVGTRAETSSRVTGKEGFEADGIQGLKALGVRELSYRLAFLANYVAPTNPRVRAFITTNCN